MKVVLPLIHLDNIVFTPLPQLLLKQQLVLDNVCDPEDVVIIEHSREDDMAAVFSEIVGHKPDVAAFSCYVWNFRAVRQLSKAIKDYYGSKVKMVWGGPHVSEKPRWFAQEYKDCVDYVIGWYGELSFSQLVKSLQAGDADPAKIPAYTASHDASCAKAPEFDELPLPYNPDWFPDTMKRDIGKRVFLYETYRNCLPFETELTTPFGKCYLGEIAVGDKVLGFDGENPVWNEVKQVFKFGVKPVYRVEAESISVEATEDHPFYTKNGYVLLKNLIVGDEILLFGLMEEVDEKGKTSNEERYSLQDVREEHGSDTEEDVFSRMYLSRKEGVAGRASGREQDSTLLCLREAAYEAHEAASVRQLEFPFHVLGRMRRGDAASRNLGEEESHEEEARSRQGQPNDQGGVGGFLLGADEEQLGNGEDHRRDVQREHGTASEQLREPSGVISSREGSSVQIRGRFPILDRPLQVGEVQESGFHPHDEGNQEGDSGPREVLAQRSCPGQEGDDGLCEQGMGGIHHLGRRSPQRRTRILSESFPVRFAKIKEVRPAGARIVYDIETSPSHNFFANGILVHNCPFSCLSGDTLVNTVYGPIKIKELSERFEEVGVYTYNREAREVLVSTARNIRRTGKNKRLVRIHFTDGSFIDCTPDHQFSAFTCGRGGLREWDEQAKDLRPGMRVRAVQEGCTGPSRNYVEVTSGRFRQKKHRMVMEWMLGRELLDTEIVHHRDHDTFNNEPENLELLSSAKEHMDRHPELSQRMRENNPTKKGVNQEWRDKLRKAITGKKRSEETKRRMKESARLREANMTEEEKTTRSERTKKMIAAKKAEGCKWGNTSKSKSDGRFCSKDGETNHRVDHVEIIPGRHDVYCMEVPETGWFFANNVLVHNCSYCLWGKASNKIEGAPYDKVMAGFETLLSLGMKHLKFADAGLGVVKKDNRDKRIWRTLADMNLQKRGVALRTYFFWQVIDDEWAEIFAKLISQGVIGTMDLGIQTFNPKALTDMKRPTDYDRFNRVIGILQRHRIPYAIDLILGLPGDDLQGFRHSVRTCIGHEPKRFQSFLCSVLPGAGYDLRREELGIKTIAGSLMDDDEKVVETKTFPREDVQKALDLEAWLYFVFSLQVCDGAVRKAAEDSGVDPLSAVESLKSWCMKKAPCVSHAISCYRKNLYDSRQKGRVQCDESMAEHFREIYLELMEWASLMGVEEEMRDGLLKFPKTCKVASSLHGVDDCYFEQCFITRMDEAYTWKEDPIMGVIGTKYAFWTWDKVKEEVPCG